MCAKEYDYSKLRGRIVEKFGTMSRFADELGTSPVVISNKINNKTGFSRADIEAWSNALDISSAEYDIYYFVHKV